MKDVNIINNTCFRENVSLVLPVVLFCMIFSSMSALTLTDAVCKGGPMTSFFSLFLFSASYNIQKKTNR